MDHIAGAVLGVVLPLASIACFPIAFALASTNEVFLPVFFALGVLAALGSAASRSSSSTASTAGLSRPTPTAAPAMGSRRPGSDSSSRSRISRAARRCTAAQVRNGRHCVRDRVDRRPLADSAATSSSSRPSCGGTASGAFAPRRTTSSAANGPRPFTCCTRLDRHLRRDRAERPAVEQPVERRIGDGVQVLGLPSGQIEVEPAQHRGRRHGAAARRSDRRAASATWPPAGSRMRCDSTVHTAASYGEWNPQGRSPGSSACTRPDHRVPLPHGRPTGGVDVEREEARDLLGRRLEVTVARHLDPRRRTVLDHRRLRTRPVAPRRGTPW